MKLAHDADNLSSSGAQGDFIKQNQSLGRVFHRGDESNAAHMKTNQYG